MLAAEDSLTRRTAISSQHSFHGVRLNLASLRELDAVTAKARGCSLAHTYREGFALEAPV